MNHKDSLFKNQKISSSGMTFSMKKDNNKSLNLKKEITLGMIVTGRNTPTPYGNQSNVYDVYDHE